MFAHISSTDDTLNDEPELQPQMLQICTDTTQRGGAAAGTVGGGRRGGDDNQEGGRAVEDWRAAEVD